MLNHIHVIPLGEWLGTPQNLTVFQKIIDVNLGAYVHLASLAMPMLRESGGSIVVVSSMAGIGYHQGIKSQYEKSRKTKCFIFTCSLCRYKMPLTRLGQRLMKFPFVSQLQEFGNNTNVEHNRPEMSATNHRGFMASVRIYFGISTI